MANLVRPVNLLPPTENKIIDFKGLDRREVVPDGAMKDMLNLTSDKYPILTQRKERTEVILPSDVNMPLRMITRHRKIALIGLDANENAAFYFDNRKIEAVDDLTADTIMVAINTKICFFPQKKYIEVVRSGDTVTVSSEYRSLDASLFVNSKAVDITGLNHAKITLSAGHGFSYDDAINITGTLSYTSGGTTKTAACNVSCIIEDVENSNTLVLPYASFIEMIGEGATNVKLTGTISRNVPDLDYVIEWNNRLWGACNADNTIYACKLGDPKNWQYFQGTSMDSYYAQQGTDGFWTGVAPYSGHIIFFKEDSMARIYGTSPSSYQISNAACFGVESGSSNSVVTINDVVYYKSKLGIMAYYGTNPVCISDNFDAKTRNAVAGTDGRKYYVSLQREGAGYELLTYDIEKQLWHREDQTRMRSCCTIDNEMYMCVYADDILLCDEEEAIVSPWLYCVDSTETASHIYIVGADDISYEYSGMDWYAEFGPFDEYLENKKIYSKLSLRLVPPKRISDLELADENDEIITDENDEFISVDRWLKVYMSLDEGPWELVQIYEPPEIGGEVIPIVPRRCDRYSIRLEGKGECSIKSLTRRIRAGTFGKL